MNSFAGGAGRRLDVGGVVARVVAELLHQRNVNPAVLEFRHHDKSNQLGDLAQGPYSDWTAYLAGNRSRACSFCQAVKS